MRTAWWVWPVLGGTLIGIALLVRAGLGVVRGLPDDARERIGDVLRRRVRFVSVAAVVLAWTLVYALYSMTLPARVHAERSNAPVASNVESPTAALRRIIDNPDAVVRAATGEHAPPADEELPPTGNLPKVDTGPGQKPCSVKQQSDMVRAIQARVEQITGRPVGADFSVLVDAIAGCADPASAALALLGPINVLIQQVGILPDTIDLPNPPVLSFPTVPEPIAAPLRPYVFDVCAQVSEELTVASAVSIFLHLNYDDVVALFHNVDAICSAFAPA